MPLSIRQRGLPTRMKRWYFYAMKNSTQKSAKIRWLSLDKELYEKSMYLHFSTMQKNIQEQKNRTTAMALLFLFIAEELQKTQ